MGATVAIYVMEVRGKDWADQWREAREGRVDREGMEGRVGREGSVGAAGSGER